MDRVKEVTGYGEPLYVDVCAAAFKEGKTYDIVGGTLRLGSKDVTPGSIISIYENLKADQPKNNFTIGIVDDVTGHSLPIIPEVDVAPAGTTSCKFWGLGADGTVGANKNSIKIIGDHTDMYAQAYFHYDSRSPVVLHSHIFVSVRHLSVLHTLLRQLTLSHVITRLISICMIFLGDIKEGGYIPLQYSLVSRRTG